MPQDLVKEDYIGHGTAVRLSSLFLNLLTPKYVIATFKDIIACPGRAAPGNSRFILEQHPTFVDIWIYDESDFFIEYNTAVSGDQSSILLAYDPDGDNDSQFFQLGAGGAQEFDNDFRLSQCGLSGPRGQQIAYDGSCEVQTLTRYTISNYIADTMNFINTDNGFYNAHDSSDPATPQPPFDPITTHLLSNRSGRTSCYIKFDKNQL